MTTRRELNRNLTVEAIPTGDTDQRLSALIRRHGGKPYTPPKPGAMVLPSVGKRKCKDQLPLLPTVREAREAADDEA